MDIAEPFARLPILWLGLGLLILAVGATFLGMRLGRYVDTHRIAGTDDDVKGAIVPAVLGLLALLLGFTFALAVDRFETRRELVLQEANAIGTAYLQSQLLPEPHRTQFGALFIRYTDNRIRLAGNLPPEALNRQLALNDGLVNALWAETAASYADIRQYPFAGTFVSSVNAVIDLDSSRKVGRMAHVPGEVFWLLIIYAVMAAAIVGYVVRSRSSFYLACVMNLLLVSSLMLIMDIDRPERGGIRESQFPMLLLRKSMAGG